MVGADNVVVAIKASFERERDRLRSAMAEAVAAGWADGVALSILEGPSEYLYGEETALLEVVNGRPPFPRIAPPFRHGADEVGTDSAAPADVTMAAPGAATDAPPALVNNAETLANGAGILAHGPTWYRSVGTAASPGTVVCTVAGATRRCGVAEFPMGTPLAEVIDVLGGGPAGNRITAVLSGVANPFLPRDSLNVGVAHEAMEAAGSGLGAAGFIVFDDTVDLIAAAAGVARFLAVESCGQCTPCKQDGLEIAGLLADLARGEPGRPDALELLAERAATVADEARCFLAFQQQRVTESLLAQFPDALRAAASGQPGGAPVLIAPLVDLIDDRAVIDQSWPGKQPDWSYDDEDSGQAPADRVADTGGPQPHPVPSR